MNLNADNYFSRESSTHYMSCSQFKGFMHCQAAAMAAIRGEYEREKTTALLVGSYVDAALTGDLEQFKADTPEIFKRDGTLKAEYAQADTMIERCRRDKMFMEYVGGQHQVIMTGVIAGVPVKVKIDSLHDDKIVDLKTAKDFGSSYDDELGRVPWFTAYSYELQGAVYQEIVRQNTGKVLPFYLDAATKEKVTDYAIIHIAQSDMEFALEMVKSEIVQFDAIKKGIIEPDRCEKCAYCRETKMLTEVIESDSSLI